MKMQPLLIVALALGLLAILIATSQAKAANAPKELDRTTVDSLDLDRYLGTWYEIARKPHFFEKGMSYVTATYTLQPDGSIEVVNKGIKNGKPKTSRGKAKTTDQPGRLKVTFFLFPAEYNVLEVGPEYEYAVVGGSNGNYLWILSRTPALDDALLEAIYGRLAERGYDLSNVTMVPQNVK